MRGPPVDVSIGAGTSQTITTKDDEGNTIDSAVATLSHRLLMPNYTINVTYVAEGTVSIYEAVIGLTGSSDSSATATPTTSVNYVVENVQSLILVGGSGITDTVKDGTTNLGGNTIDSGITGVPTHPLYPGWIISFAAISGNPTVIAN